MMKQIKFYVLLICIIIFCFNLTGCNEEEANPILNVVVDASPGGIGVLSDYKYYTVYDNGTVKKTEEFSRIDTECYAFNPSADDKSEPYLYDVDGTSEKHSLLNDMAKNINTIVSNDKKFAGEAGTLYVIDDKYYFNVYLKKGANDVSVAIFEYELSNNDIDEVATFKYDISHIQPVG